MAINMFVQNFCKFFCVATLFTSSIYAKDVADYAHDLVDYVDDVADDVHDAAKELKHDISRAQVGERALSAIEMAAFEAERAVKAIDAKPLEGEHVSKPLYQSSHPGAFHSIYKAWSAGSTIELNDRSVWKIQKDYNFSNWRQSDVVMISPSGHFQYPYCLTNQRTAEYVLARLHLGPDLSSPYKMAIYAIYPEDGYINLELSDGSRWIMSALDYAILAGWSIGDTVIIGINTDVWNAQGNNILINVSTNNRASGSCIEY